MRPSNRMANCCRGRGHVWCQWVLVGSTSVPVDTDYCRDPRPLAALSKLEAVRFENTKVGAYVVGHLATCPLPDALRHLTGLVGWIAPSTPPTSAPRPDGHDRRCVGGTSKPKCSASAATSRRSFSAGGYAVLNRNIHSGATHATGSPPSRPVPDSEPCG